MHAYPIGPFKEGPILVPRIRHTDSRGSFEMAFEFEKIRRFCPSVPEIQQVNILQGVKGSIRGFHWSELSNNHWKVLTVVQGVVRDAFLDVRKFSTTYGFVGYLDLDINSMVSLVIPPGFAHGIQTISESSTTVYATNVSYKRNKEESISPINAGLSKIWIDPMIISDRDKEAADFPSMTNVYKLDFKLERE